MVSDLSTMLLTTPMVPTGNNDNKNHSNDIGDNDDGNDSSSDGVPIA